MLAIRPRLLVARVAYQRLTRLSLPRRFPIAQFVILSIVRVAHALPG
jgi:hypothetical protein